MRKIILDCDPGHDDAIALLLAGANPQIDLVAVTTVAGNAEVEKTSLNALKVCEIAGLHDVPVARGAEKPLLVNRKTAPDIHGTSGLDGPELPHPTKSLVDEHAVDLIIRELMASNGDITLVPVGPLTNIALAMLKEPRIVPKIQEIVLMGGGSFGNKTPAAEFNIYVDAEAAQIVFSSGAPLTMIGLDLTHQAIATPEIVEQMRAISHPISQFVVELLTYFNQTYKDVFGFEGAPIHDACAVAYCIDPQILTGKKYRVEIETKGEWTYGMTVIDRYGSTAREPNAYVAETLHKERFWQLIMDTLQRYTEG